ncbi:MAG: hypothetical protein QM754_03765 [Tepidisphaeraceae bacterium]
MQNVIAILLVLGCVLYVGTQLLKTVRAGTGKAGKCCSHGCDAGSPVSPNSAATAPASPREQFISADLLRRKK